MRNIVAEEACPNYPTKENQGTGKEVLIAESIEYIGPTQKVEDIIDADARQAAGEIALGRMIV